MLSMVAILYSLHLDAQLLASVTISYKWKNHFFEMKGVVGIAKEHKQEALGEYKIIHASLHL